MRVLLQNNSNGNKYLVVATETGEGLTDEVNVNVTTLPLPEQDSSQTLLMNFGGASRTLTLSWVGNDTTSIGLDLSNGTRSGGLYTVLDQYNWLISNFVSADSSVTFTVTLLKDDGSTFMTFQGVMQKLTVQVAGGETFIKCTLTFLQGLNVG